MLVLIKMYMFERLFLTHRIGHSIQVSDRYLNGSISAELFNPWIFRESG
jgi:hypothetical protein